MKRGEHELGREGRIETDGKLQARQSCKETQLQRGRRKPAEKRKSSRLHDRECERLEALNTATSGPNIGHTIRWA
jgi:hypothetical protein